MKDYFVKFFKYNFWANNRLILKLAHVEEVFAQPISLMSHIISVQDMWLERILQKEEYLFNVWDNYSIQECKILNSKSYNAWTEFLSTKNEAGFEESIQYLNPDGEKFTQPLYEIFVHVLSHSEYHRGQINFLLKENGIEPPTVDFISFSKQLV